MREDELFSHVINVILSNEGGYSNNSNDRGGLTKFGISSRSYPDVDIANLTKEEAKNIYRRDFWDKYLYGKIGNQEIATKFFDLAVNMGHHWACVLVQRALRASGKNVVEDGDFGPKTLDAINNVDSTDLLASLKSEAAGYYRTLAAIDKQDKVFLKGWLNRAYS
ncbi:MAG: glycoside hydrolase family 108 protein [Paraclostridium sp.]|jgi:lysozyme family protein